MRARSRDSLIAAGVAGAWALAAALAAWSGRATPLPPAPPAPKSVLVQVAPGSPAARDWAHFFACSGLSGDALLMRATLLLNDGGDEAIWRARPGQGIPVRVALAPLPGALDPRAEQSLSDAPRAVADCGVTP